METSPPAASLLTTHLKVVEPLGREILIKASLPGTSILLNAQVSPNVDVRVGDRLSLQLDLDRLFIFDPTTGDRLYP